MTDAVALAEHVAANVRLKVRIDNVDNDQADALDGAEILAAYLKLSAVARQLEGAAQAPDYLTYVRPDGAEMFARAGHATPDVIERALMFTGAEAAVLHRELSALALRTAALRRLLDACKEA